MLLKTKQLKAIVAFIDDDSPALATDQWRSAQHEIEKCTACFYESLEETVRCSVCLESHLTNAILGYTYPSIEQNDLEHAEQSIKAWIKNLKT